MNDLTLIEHNTLTMSSREIAELTGSTHDNVLKTIRRLIGEGVVFGNETPYVHDQNGEEYAQFLLDYRNTMVVTSGYNAKLRAKIIDRWLELETAHKPKLPQTFAEALRLAAEQAEQIERQQALIEQQAPAVEFVDRYVEAKSSKNLSDVAKVLGHKPHAFIKLLAEDGIIFKRGNVWIPKQEHIDANRFVVNTGESNGHVFMQTRVEPDGIAWLAKKYGK